MNSDSPSPAKPPPSSGSGITVANPFVSISSMNHQAKGKRFTWFLVMLIVLLLTGYLTLKFLIPPSKPNVPEMVGIDRSGVVTITSPEDVDWYIGTENFISVRERFQQRNGQITSLRERLFSSLSTLATATDSTDFDRLMTVRRAIALGWPESSPEHDAKILGQLSKLRTALTDLNEHSREELTARNNNTDSASKTLDQLERDSLKLTELIRSLGEAEKQINTQFAQLKDQLDSLKSANKQLQKNDLENSEKDWENLLNALRAAKDSVEKLTKTVAASQVEIRTELRGLSDSPNLDKLVAAYAGIPTKLAQLASELSVISRTLSDNASPPEGSLPAKLDSLQEQIASFAQALNQADNSVTAIEATIQSRGNAITQQSQWGSQSTLDSINTNLATLKTALDNQPKAAEATPAVVVSAINTLGAIEADTIPRLTPYAAWKHFLANLTKSTRNSLSGSAANNIAAALSQWESLRNAQIIDLSTIRPPEKLNLFHTDRLGLLLEVLIWSLFGVLTNLCLNTAEAVRRGRFHPVERYVGMTKLVYGPIMSLILCLAVINGMIDFGGYAVRSWSLPLIAFLMGYATRRTASLIERLAERILGAASKSIDEGPAAVQRRLSERIRNLDLPNSLPKFRTSAYQLSNELILQIVAARLKKS